MLSFRLLFLAMLILIGRVTMCRKIYAGVVIVVAIALAVLAMNMSIDNVDNVMRVMKFFDAMIPVLAVGALIKYICCGGSKSCGCCGSACSKCSTEKSSSK
jgi:hypothetical protein